MVAGSRKTPDNNPTGEMGEGDDGWYAKVEVFLDKGSAFVFVCILVVLGYMLLSHEPASEKLKGMGEVVLMGVALIVSMGVLGAGLGYLDELF